MIAPVGFRRWTKGLNLDAPLPEVGDIRVSASGKIPRADIAELIRRILCQTVADHCCALHLFSHDCLRGFMIAPPESNPPAEGWYQIMPAPAEAAEPLLRELRRRAAMPTGATNGVLHYKHHGDWKIAVCEAPSPVEIVIHLTNERPQTLDWRAGECGGGGWGGDVTIRPLPPKE